MSSLRTLAIAAISSFGLVIYLILWFHWPVTVSLGVGALMATVVVMTSASLGEDAAQADAAWHASAPDLMDAPPRPVAAEPPREDGPGTSPEPSGEPGAEPEASISGSQV